MNDIDDARHKLIMELFEYKQRYYETCIESFDLFKKGYYDEAISINNFATQILMNIKKLETQITLEIK